MDERNYPECCANCKWYSQPNEEDSPLECSILDRRKAGMEITAGFCRKCRPVPASRTDLALPCPQTAVWPVVENLNCCRDFQLDRSRRKLMHDDHSPCDCFDNGYVLFTPLLKLNDGKHAGMRTRIWPWLEAWSFNAGLDDELAECDMGEVFTWMCRRHGIRRRTMAFLMGECGSDCFDESTYSFNWGGVCGDHFRINTILDLHDKVLSPCWRMAFDDIQRHIQPGCTWADVENAVVKAYGGWRECDRLIREDLKWEERYRREWKRRKDMEREN